MQNTASAALHSIILLMFYSTIFTVIQLHNIFSQLFSNKTGSYVSPFYQKFKNYMKTMLCLIMENIGATVDTHD